MKKIEKTQMWASIIKFIWNKKTYGINTASPQIVKEIQVALDRYFVVEPTSTYWEETVKAAREEMEAAQKRYEKLKAEYGQEDSQNK